MSLYEPRNVGKIVLSVIFAIISVSLLYFSFTLSLYIHEFALMMIFAIALISSALYLFLSSLNRHVLVHADEEGIFTMYQFYLPWKYVDSFYAKDNFFVEIKLLDNDKYLEEMDPDIYSVFYDEIEAGHLNGHELFFFPAGYMGFECDELIAFLESARKTYAK